MKSGVRTPLLSEVLSSAQLMPDKAKLVIELKEGTAQCGHPACHMLFEGVQTSSLLTVFYGPL